MQVYMTRNQRQTQISAAIIAIASKPGGWYNLSYQNIANRCDCSHANITRHFGSTAEMRRWLLKTAVKDGLMTIVGQAIAAGFPPAKKLADTVKRAALESLIDA